MSQIIPIYIPTYINNAEYAPARVLPRLLFYNGLLDCQTYYIESGSLTTSGTSYAQNAFPYFDNYNVVTGSFPTEDSDSLLFNNEEAAYGFEPTEKSEEFAPEITTEDTFKAVVVPRFSIEKVRGDETPTPELAEIEPPFTIVAEAYFTLISCEVVAAPTAIFTSSRPILPDTLIK